MFKILGTDYRAREGVKEVIRGLKYMPSYQLLWQKAAQENA